MRTVTMGVLSTISTIGALASPCLAGGDRWAAMDRELESLVLGTAAQDPEPPELHGLLRTNWAHSPNTLTGASGAEDYRGFALDNAQVILEGRVGDKIGYRLQLEGASGTAGMIDAYGTWQSCEYVRITMGRFRSPLMWESQMDEGDLLFILRTDAGELFSVRNEGVMFSGTQGQVQWAASLQNGFDGLQEKSAITARASLDAIGGGAGLYQGAYGAGSRTKLSVGAGYFDEQSEGSRKDGDVVTLDSQLRMGPFAAEAMVAKFQDFTNANFISRSDSQPWNVSASFMLIQDRVEAAARYQDTDNIRRERDVTAGFNYYLDGHAMKFQLNASYIFSNSALLDDTIRLGLGATVRI